MFKRTFVIAEAGVNHNGSIKAALQMIDVATEAGADAVKFQSFKAEQLATAAAPKAAYQIANTGNAGSQVAMLRQLELSPADHHTLVARCRDRRIHFMSTAFDSDSLAFLATLDLPAVKIPSGDITCGPLLLQAARMRRPLIVSTGMATLTEIREALGVIAFGIINDREPLGRSEFEAAYESTEGQLALKQSVTLLHCVTQYPAPAHSVNLRAMDVMADYFGLPIGYSDHTLGIDVAIAAVARGATTIEKHFTLDRNLPGPDHSASLEPEELERLVTGIRTVEAALGSAIKEPASEELANRCIARRSIVAARQIHRGEPLTAPMLTAKRPGHGMSPMDSWALIGKVATRDYGVDDVIEP